MSAISTKLSVYEEIMKRMTMKNFSVFFWERDSEVWDSILNTNEFKLRFNVTRPEKQNYLGMELVLTIKDKTMDEAFRYVSTMIDLERL
jgi:hypothetical protein